MSIKRTTVLDLGPVDDQTKKTAPGAVQRRSPLVVEFSLTSATALILTALVDNGPIIELADEPGTYRYVSVPAARLAERECDEDAAGGGDDEEPVDWYLVQAWQAPATPHAVGASDSSHANRKSRCR
jgi:hypothetical protein